MKMINDLYARIVLFIACLFAQFYVCAQNVTIDGLKYHLFSDTHEAMIDYGNTWSGELNLPSEVNYNGETYTITGISWGAFGNCIELTKVRIPKTIIKVINRSYPDDPSLEGAVSPDCKNPFFRCTSLECIEVDEDNPAMCSVDGILFSKDKTELYCYPAGMQHEEFSIPENVTWIGCGAIADNNYLSSLIMPNSVTYCGGICDNCVNLKNIKLSESLTYLVDYAFDNCVSLKFLEIPESIQEFGAGVFRWTHFEKIVIRGTFPNGLRRDSFYCMDDATILYVQQSEIEKFKRFFSGTVLPLEEYTDNIEQIEIHQPSAPLYDLQGRRLSDKPDKGLYIQNGKKYVVK